MVPSIHTLVHDPKKIGKSPNPIKQWKGKSVRAQNSSWNVSFTSWKWQVDDVGATDWERSGRQYVTVQTPRDSYQTPTASALEGHLQPLFWTVGGQNIKSHLPSQFYIRGNISHPTELAPSSNINIEINIPSVQAGYSTFTGPRLVLPMKSTWKENGRHTFPPPRISHTHVT